MIDSPPTVYLMVGLQGSGKTTTTAKIAKRYSDKRNKKVLMASLDIYRPAAQEQLRQLGEQINVDTLPVVEGEKPEAITSRALEEARLSGYDILILDTAGRLSIDETLMNEVAAVKAMAKPAETLLVVDAMTGQDAVNTAENFEESVGVSGIVLTRIDGDTRGGAALSMRAVTGKPIKLMGTGEKLNDLSDFHPDRIAGRILDMGDVVTLVEQAAEKLDKDETEDLAKSMMRGEFNLEHYKKQIKQMNKLGGIGSIMGMMPGMGKLKKAMKETEVDESIFKYHTAIIDSMTPHERHYPRVLNASRKRRIAAGSGTTVQEINTLLKQHRQMKKMMKRLTKMGGGGMMTKGLGALLGR